MLMTAVPSVDDWRLAHFCQMIRCPGHRMAHDNAIRGHGLEITRRVEQRFTFRHARSGNTDIDCIGGKTFRGDLKGSSRACGRLEEKIDYGAAAQGGYFFYFAPRDITKSLRRVQQMYYFTSRKLSYSQQMSACKSSGHISLLLSVVRCSLSAVRYIAGTVTTTDNRPLTTDEYKKAASVGRSHSHRLRGRPLDDYHSFLFIKILEHHFYDFALLRRHKLANVISLDGKLSMLLPSVNKHC